MSFDLAAMHAFVVQEIGSQRSLSESMQRVIAKSAEARPHHDWDRLASLPYDDLVDLRAWISNPFQVEPAKEMLAGLWFGLFIPVYAGKPVADIYVCGSTRFAPDPEDNSWAVSPAWWPDSRCARSSVLASIYKIATAKDGLGNDAEYPLCLAYGGLAVRDLLRSVKPSVFLGKSPSLGVAVGFDSGDFMLLGNLSSKGLVAF